MRRPRRRPPTAARPRRRKPGGNRRTRAPRSVAKVRGFPWFVPEQWDKLREVAADRGNLAADYETWLAESQSAYEGLATCGVNVKKVLVDVDQLRAWCEAERLAVDADSRPAFVRHLLITGRAEVVE